MSTRHRILCGAVALAVFCPAAEAVDFNAFKTDEEAHVANAPGLRPGGVRSC